MPRRKPAAAVPVEAPAPVANDKLIAELEALLDQARSGTITGAGFAVSGPGEYWRVGWHFSSRGQLPLVEAASGTLNRRLRKLMDE